MLPATNIRHERPKWNGLISGPRQTELRWKEYFSQILNVINDNDDDDETIEEDVNASDE